MFLLYKCFPCFSMQELARGDSFSAISSVGPNAAINHYFVSVIQMFSLLQYAGASSWR